MTIKIKGVIGWDVIGTQISDMISRCDGDINLEIDSPGGSMSDGFSIANALEDYSKGKIHIKVVGQCSSMAAYIMLFGDSSRFLPETKIFPQDLSSSAIARPIPFEAPVTKIFICSFPKPKISTLCNWRIFLSNFAQYNMP